MCPWNWICIHWFYLFNFRSYAQLRATFDEYERIAKKDISESIKAEFSGDIKKAMLTVG